MEGLNLWGIMFCGLIISILMGGSIVGITIEIFKKISQSH